MAAKKDDLMETMTTLATAGGGSGLSPVLVALLERKLAKELAAEEQKELELRRLLEARSVSFRAEIEGRRNMQSACPHRKEDNRSRIGGQKLSDGTVLYLCQACGKEWRGGELPMSLAIPFELIGG